MMRLRSLLVCCFALVGGVQAQSLREAAALLFASDQEAQRLRLGRPAVEASTPVIRGELLPQIKLDGSSNFPKTGPEGGAGATEDLLSRQLSRSLQQWWHEGASAYHCSPEEKHRQAMQEFLDMSVLETRVVDLAAVYLDLLRADRRIVEAKKNLAQGEQIRASLAPKPGSAEAASEAARVDQWLADAQGDLAAQREAKRKMQNRFQRLTGRVPEVLSAPAVPSVPADRSKLDLSQNWNYLAATEAVLAVGSGREATARERLPALFLETCKGPETSGAGEPSEDDPGAPGRRAAWQAIKAQELRRAADLQRQYAISLLWREHQADAAAISSLRTQTGLLASAVAKGEREFQERRRSLDDLLSLYERLSESRARLIDTEAGALARTFRMLGVQGRCAEYVMGAQFLEELLPGEWEKLRQSGPEGEACRLAGETGAEEFPMEAEDPKREGVLRALTLVAQPEGLKSRDLGLGAVTWVPSLAAGGTIPAR